MNGTTMKTYVTRSMAIVAVLGLVAAVAMPALAGPAQPEHGAGAQHVGAQRAFEVWNDSAADAVITIYRIEPNGARAVVQSTQLKKRDRLVCIMHEGTTYVLHAFSIRESGMHKIMQADDHRVDPNTVTKAYLRNAEYRYYWQ